MGSRISINNDGSVGNTLPTNITLPTNTCEHNINYLGDVQRIGERYFQRCELCNTNVEFICSHNRNNFSKPIWIGDNMFQKCATCEEHFAFECTHPEALNREGLYNRTKPYVYCDACDSNIRSGALFENAGGISFGSSSYRSA